MTSLKNLANFTPVLGGTDDETMPSTHDQLLTIDNISILSYSIPSSAADIIMKKRDIVSYAVKTGDTLSAIAEDHNISLNTLLWANKLTNKSKIQPGQELEILPISGAKHTVKNGENISFIAKKYGTTINAIIEFNNLPADAFISVGDKLVVPGGKAQNTSTQNSYASQVTASTVSIGYFIYPTSGRNWGVLHNVNAIDIANRCGTPIYAAADGKVILVDEVGWNRGYGNYMMIRHPNGVETLYSHFTNIVSSVNDYVDQGDLIGYMGTTGHSTGCHLHFEVRGAINPFVR
jgi:murein DD-endopeptidase MepM/ murein hydrolase activator NlpD